jgi:hypothetical protein
LSRALLILTAVAALVMQTVGAAAAASPNGNGTTTIRYQSAEYFDFVLGATVVCEGIHQYGPRWPGDATSGGRDVYRCRSLSGPFTNVSHADGFTYAAGEWSSDYFFDYQSVVVTTTQPTVLRISGSNDSYHAISVYAQR